MMPADLVKDNPWERLYQDYTAAAMSAHRDHAFRRRTHLIRQARKLLGRAYRVYAEWVMDALEDSNRTEFMTTVLATNVPRYFVAAMLRAGVHEPDFRAKRRFIEPCVWSYGYEQIIARLLPYLEDGTPAEQAGAAFALYWVSIREEYFWSTGRVIDARTYGPTRQAQVRYEAWRALRDKRTALLTTVCLTNMDNDVRRCIVDQIFPDPGVPDAALRALGAVAREMAYTSDNRYVRWRATRLHHGFATERAVREARLRLDPELRPLALARRSFLRRCVSFLSARGIDQFLTLDSDLPPIHKVVQAANPVARTLYVSSDPIIAHFLHAIQRTEPAILAVHADIADPEVVLATRIVSHLIDDTRPVAFVLLSALEFLHDDARARQVVRLYREALPPGSYLVVSQDARRDLGEESDARKQIAAFLTDLEVVEPGIVAPAQWRPEPADTLLLESECEWGITLCGVGYKPYPL